MPIDPASLSGKTLWLRAKDLGSGGSSVSTWADASGQNNSLTASGTTPTVSASATPSGGKAVSFGGSGFFTIAPTMFAGGANARGWANGEEPYRAFDGSTGTQWTDTGAGSGTWLSVAAVAAATLTGYSIRVRTGQPNRSPKTWTMQGSNDNSTWTTLDTRTGETFTDGGINTYTVTGAGSYQFYRINITAVASGTACNITELALTGPTLAQTAAEVWYVVKSNEASGNYRALANLSKNSSLASHYPASDGTIYENAFLASLGARRQFTPSVGITSWRLYRVTHDGTTYAAFLDETSQFSISAPAFGTAPMPYLGANGSSSNEKLNGYVAEVMVFNRATTSGERADLITYFNTEHGLSVPGGSSGATDYPVTGQVDATTTTEGAATANYLLSGQADATSGTLGAFVGGVDYPVTGQADVISGTEGAATADYAVGGQVDAVSGAEGDILLTGGAQSLSGSFAFGSSLTSDAITVAAQTLSGGFAFGSTQASLTVEVEQADGGFSFGSRLKQLRDWGIDPRSTRPSPSVVIAHRDGTPVTNLPEVNIGELTSAVGALDSWQFTVDRDNAEGKKVDPVALEAHLYRGTVLMSKGPIGPGRLNDGRMIYDVSDPRWYLWDGRHIDRRPRLNWVYNGDFSLGTAGWAGGYEPGSIPEAIPEFSVVDEPESTSGKGLRIGGVDKVVTSVANVETAAVFVPNSSAYLSGGAAVLIAAANGIPNGSNINIVGHTADRRAYGDPGNGLALSLARAQAARSTLHAHNATWTFSLLPGLRSPNMNDGVVAGRGYYEQVASNSTEASSAKNRRVALHYASTQTAAGHKQYVYQRKTGIVNPVSSKVELPVVISGRMRIGEWLGAPANGFALWAQVYNSSGVAVGATSGSVEPATATMSEQTPRERWIDYDVTVNIPPDGLTYWIEYRLFPPAGWAVWSDIEVTPDEQLGFFDVDQALIIRDLVAFAQDTAYGHGPLGIGSRTPLTGVTRTKEYKFREHRPVGTAVEELTSMAHGPEVDCEMTPNSATVVTHYPRQGTVASFSLAHGGPRSIVKAYQPLPANTRTLASSVIVQAWGISNNRYERFVKDDAALGGALLETVIDADAATPVNELAEVARQSLARSIHPLAAWEVTLDPARTSEVLDEIGKGDVVLLSLPDEDVHALHRIVAVIWSPETDVLTLQLAPEEA